MISSDDEPLSLHKEKKKKTEVKKSRKKKVANDLIESKPIEDNKVSYIFIYIYFFTFLICMLLLLSLL